MPLWEIFWNASGTLGGKEIREGEIGGGGEGTRGKELLSERIVNEAPSPPPTLQRLWLSAFARKLGVHDWKRREEGGKGNIWEVLGGREGRQLYMAAEWIYITPRREREGGGRAGPG